PESMASAAADLPHFVKVSDQLYRGGRPSADGLQQLNDLGIKTVIDLQGGDLHSVFLPYVYFSEPGERVKRINAEESAWTSNPKHLFYSFPINSMKKITDEESKMIFNQILPTLEDPDHFPVYVHCEH